MDAELTDDERFVLQRLRAVAKRWPAKLYLITRVDSHNLSLYRGHPEDGGIEIGVVNDVLNDHIT